MNPRYLEELSWRMSEVYAATVDQILINLARHFKFYTETGVLPSGGWDYQIKKLAEMGQVNRETEQIILNMLGDADGTLRELLEVSILNGLKDAEPELRLAAKKGLFGSADNIHPVLDPSQMQAFQAYYKQSADKLNLVNTVMLESTQNAYLSTVTDIATRIMNTQGILNVQTGQVVTGVTSINKAIRDGVKKMVDNGLTGFIDHGNHHWSPEAYVAMDVRTTMANTARAAVWERNEDYGNDLYQVSYHAGARPLCYDWQGKVISSSDTPRDVEDDEGNTVHVYAQSETTYGEPAGLFGINCGHYPIPFIPGFSRIRPPTQSKEENDKTYRESQQQRALERKLREEKRDLEVMKAQGASEAEIKEQKKRVREASDNINDFCQQTGRTRKRNRETAPIRAEFPEQGGTTVRYNGGYIPANAVPPPKGAFVPTPPTITPNVAPTIPTVTPTQNVNPQLTTPAPSVVQSTVKPYKLSGLSGDYADMVADKFKNGNETARKAWEKCIPDGGCIEDAHFGGTPQHKNGKVYLDITADATNQRGAGCTFFHENGHALDYYAGWLSDDSQFFVALKSDYEAALKATGKKTKDDQRFALSMELCKPDIANKANGVSDILDGLSKGKCKGWYGHGAKYWRDRPDFGVQREAFAHMNEAAYLDGQREMINKYFPTAYKRFIELLEGVI